MNDTASPTNLPQYHAVVSTLAPLNLPISASELHGLICGYLCTGADQTGETYIRSMLSSFPKDDAREAMKCLFELYTLSQQQFVSDDFSFYMLLPDESESLSSRAQAFSEWCEGFTQGITLSGVMLEDLQDEDSQDALNHISEFAQLDYETLEYGENDERALMEVSEYTRVAVIGIHQDFIQDAKGKQKKDTH